MELALVLKMLFNMTMLIIKDNNDLKLKASYIKNELFFQYHWGDSEIQGLSYILMYIITMILTNGL